MECLLSIVPCFVERSADSAAKHAAYIRDLEDNRESLVTEIGKLKCIRDDLSNIVKEAEGNRMKRTNQVNDWLERVEAVEEKAGEILPKVTQELEKRCLGGCCPKNCKNSYKLGKEVAKMIPQVTRLTEEGKFDVVADKLPAPPVDELLMENAVVGFESKFEEVWQSVQSEDTAIIGLVGMGGVGKTTLLKQLNNEFLKATHGYDVVIWIVVSKPVNLGNIQDSFRSKLNIPDHLWDHKSEGERAILISDRLKHKKFVVLLDDIWDRLEPSEVGIPQPSRENMSKAVFTTRSREVCHSMEAHKLIEVTCLLHDQAFSLFRSKVGEDMLKCHQEIMGLVEDVAKECQGLPLALITIGRSMRGKTNAQQWKDAKQMLEKYPATFPGVEGRVFSKLVFSYDSLPTPTVRECFKYCSLYPEDHNIAKDEIIMLWIAERLVDEYDNMSDALLQGRQIIESLMQAGLLEAGDKEETVRMHDVIRDLSLWLACERGEKKNKILVEVPDDIPVTPNVMEKWRTNVEKVSLWGRGTTAESLAGLSFCSNLVTLIIRDTQLKEMPDRIFLPMKVLKVLDLSDNIQLRRLPREIGSLTCLEYLSIMMTEVIGLPMEVEQLKNLRFLRVAKGTIVPRTVISSLRLLLTFEQGKIPTPNEVDSGTDLNNYRADCRSTERGMLEELEGLEHIMYLCLTLTSAAGIQKFFDSPKLQSCTGELILTTKGSLSAELDLATRTLTKLLEKIHVADCVSSVIKLGRSSLCSNIREVSFKECNEVRNLNSLVYVPNLCVLRVSACWSMEELIGEDSQGTDGGMLLFSRLTHLDLARSPKLRSICPQSALPFPSLKLMRVHGCKALRKLPLDSNTASTIPREFRIKGWKDWWDGLEWDSQATKDAFTPKFEGRFGGAYQSHSVFVNGVDVPIYTSIYATKRGGWGFDDPFRFYSYPTADGIDDFGDACDDEIGQAATSNYSGFGARF